MTDPLAYLNSLGVHKIKPGLGRIKKLLNSLGNPQNKVPGIIIAGTNGKGSVASAVSSVLEAQGYKTGLYTSPHLINITERIKINGEEIPIAELENIIRQVKDSGEQAAIGTPSYFEVLTASAFLYFSEQRADLSVLEVGMGGRWDATNVITPLVSVITAISKDHTKFLGRTIGEIALEKACIIKRNVPVVTAAKGKALRVILKRAEEYSSPVRVYGRHFKSRGESTERFSYSGTEWELTDLSSNLFGLYQLENLSVAIAALESIAADHGIKIEEKNLRKGLARINWGGRFEIIRKNPPLILDSAHNVGGARALVESLTHTFPDKKITFMIGMLKDKNHSLFLKELSPIAEEVIITGIPPERAMGASDLSKTASKYLACDIRVIDDYRKAFLELKKTENPACIAGSIYLAGAVKEIM